MIYDSWENVDRYRAMNPEVWALVYGFFNTLTEDSPNGKYPLKEGDIFALVQSYQTKKLDEAATEIHQEYIDIQALVSGEEDFYVSDISHLFIRDVFNAEKDIAFYDFAVAKSAPLLLQNGNFVVCFPWEGHAPGVSVADDAPSAVKKVVFKIRADLFGC